VDAADNGNAIDDENFRLGWEGAYDVAVSPDGKVAVLAGAVTVDRHAGEIDLLTVGVDVASGDELWRAIHANPDGGGDFPSTVLVSPDGTTAYVSATVGLFRQEPPDMALIAYDLATGEVHWSASYDVGRPDTASYDFDAALSPSGDYLNVIGVTADTQGRINSLLWRVDSADGAQEWALEQDGPFGGYALSTDVDVSSIDGTVVVGGTTWDPERSRADYWVRAIRPDGTMSWEERFDGGSYDQLIDLAISPDGRTVAATGMSDNIPDYTNQINGGQNRDWATVTWDVATGQFGWQGRETGHARGDNRPFDLAFSPDSQRLYVAGAVTDETVVTVRYGVKAYPVDTGHSNVTYLYRGEAAGAMHPFNVATALAVSPGSDRLYVTGYSSTLTPSNPLIAYAGGGPVYAQNHPLDVATVTFRVTSGGLAFDSVARWNPSPGFTDEMIPAGIAVAPGNKAILVAGTLLYHVSQEFADQDDLGHQNFFDVGLLRYDPS
jgi:WD40 repeat protein